MNRTRSQLDMAQRIDRTDMALAPSAWSGIRSSLKRQSHAMTSRCTA
jgi:hypothetical protein